MKQVATAAKIYGWDLLPEGPTVLERLVESGLVTRKQTICSSSGMKKSDYVLVPIESDGSGVDSRTPVMYEPKSNHGSEGGIFVFADGHAEFVGGEEYDELVKGAAVYQRRGDP